MPERIVHQVWLRRYRLRIEDEEKPIQFQRHEPLGFVGHRFNETEKNWSVAEKEGFAIKDKMQKLDYLLQMRKRFKLSVAIKTWLQYSHREIYPSLRRKNSKGGLWISSDFDTRSSIYGVRITFGL